MESHPWKPGTEKIWQDAIKGKVEILTEYLRTTNFSKASRNHKEGLRQI